MKPTNTILIGAPLSGDEARFLRVLNTDLASTGALIFANFCVDEQQIDFFVVTPTYAALLELKNFPRPIFGDKNGVWKYLDASGNLIRHAGTNPWQQTLKQKYALSDEMKRYQNKNPEVPLPAGKGFFSEFAGFVCVYPAIHTESQVTDGDHKVEVRSYSDILDAIRLGGKASTWSIADWELFAQRHLRLSRVTVEEATDSRVLEAGEMIAAYRERVRTIIGAELPPLLETDEKSDHGTRLIARLLEPHNYLIIGPSGAAKTFHLHHLAIAIASSAKEIPLLLEVKKYRGGDFWSLLRQCVAPFLRGDPKELLDSMRLCGLRPVLLIDGLNECANDHRSELMKGAQAFVLRLDARVVLTSQQVIQLSASLQSQTISLPLPDLIQKRAIYAHHAGLPVTAHLDLFCAGFTNAYDVTIAGRCHVSGSAPESRVDLYDRYVRYCLPKHTAVASALLRRIAGEMGRAFCLELSRDDFEIDAEKFLAEQHLSLDVLDSILPNRLIQLSAESVAFEHQLLFEYFKAEELRRRTDHVEALAEELRKPRNQDLIEFLLPRFADPIDLAVILASTPDPASLSRICAGECGKRAQHVLLDECERLIEDATRDLSNIQVDCLTAQTEDGRRRLVNVDVKGHREWTPRDALVCQVIANNLSQPRLQQRFLQLLDSTEWSLRIAVNTAAKRAGFKPSAVWEEAVRLYGGVLIHGTLRLPCTAILSVLRNFLMNWYRHKQGLPIRDRLLERVHRNPVSHFSLLTLLQDHDAPAVTDRVMENISLVNQAWASGIYILRVDALEYLESMNRVVHETCPEKLPRIREMLESFKTDNLFENTVLLETLASYDGLELAITSDNALAEMRSLINPNALADPNLAEMAELFKVTPLEYLAGQAYGCLGKIFEDVFQGVYWEAYEELSNSEKCDVLCLAAQSRDIGFLLDWLLQELLDVGEQRALPIFRRFASDLSPGLSSQQERVAAFTLAIQGCARYSESPPIYTGGDSPEHKAWQLIGEILFWLYRNTATGQDPGINKLWARLDGEVLVAAGDVIYQLSDSNWHLRGDRKLAVDLMELFPHQIRRIVEACLSAAGPIPSVFPYGGSSDRGLIAFLIRTLGRVGDETAIPKLQSLADDLEFGKDAIRAIESIQRTIIAQRSIRPQP